MMKKKMNEGVDYSFPAKVASWSWWTCLEKLKDLNEESLRIFKF